MSKRKAVALLVVGVLFGLMFTPIPANAAMTVQYIWSHIKPMADTRYVQQGATAYAYVKTNATFDATRTKSFIGLSRPHTGTYCLTPAPKVDLLTHPAVATPEYGNSFGTDLQVYVRVSAPDCLAGALEVMTYNAGAISDDTAFTVWVP